MPVYQGSYREYRRLHPAGEVMVYSDTHHHRDPRHGHGSEDYPGRPGLGTFLYDTLEEGRVDPRLPANELILGVNDDLGVYAVPLRDLRKDQGVAYLELEGVPIVVLGLRATHTMGAYRRAADGAILGFVPSQDDFVDDRTGSRWNVEGRCMDGPLAGRRLDPVDFVTLVWHAFAAYHPATPVYRSGRTRSIQPVEDPLLREVVERIARAGSDIEIQWPVLEAWRPETARASVELVVDGDPVRIFHFNGDADAEDWAILQRRSVARGCLAGASFPVDLYENDAQTRALPHDRIRWAALVSGGELGRILDDVRRECGAGHAASSGLGDIVVRMREAGKELTGVTQLLGSQLPVGAEVGFGLWIDRDRWQLLRFPTEAGAAGEAGRRGHCIQAGRFVLWSDPPTLYEGYETITRPDDRVRWSPRLEDEAFQRLVRAAVT